MLRLFNGLKPLIELPIKNVSKFSSCCNLPTLRLFQNSTNSIVKRNYSSLLIQKSVFDTNKNVYANPGLLKVQSDVMVEQSRSVIKFSMKKGKRKANKEVPKRFYRLHWGMWIRPIAGRHRKLWKKSSKLKNKLLQHVFTNSTQSWLLDKMVTRFWRKPRYWVDNIYEPYNTREEFYTTRRKPHDPDEIDPSAPKITLKKPHKRIAS